MAGIFINYRRDDAPGVAGRLYDHLARRFPKRDLFMDVDAMKPGFDFVKQLDAQVSQCDALLAVIGPQWLAARDDKGRRRLDGDRDYVRIEIAAALKRDIPVIPVLIDGASVPPEEELPDDLKSLARRHGMELRHTRFNVDADAIIAALQNSLPRSRRRIWPFAAAGLAAVACVAALVVLWPQISALLQQTSEAPKPAVSEEVKKERDQATAQKKPAPLKSAAQIEGVSVALGDTMDAVKAAYPSGSVTGDQLYLPLSGIRLIFDKDNLTLRMIRVDAPFTGSVQGLRIGDSLDNVLRMMGQPYTVPWDFGGNKAYAYNVGDTVVRYDIDKANKIATIFYFPRSR
jgi:hypothetical protein